MKKRDIRILQSINERVVAKYKDRLFNEVDIYATTLKLIAHYTKPEEYKKLNDLERKKIDELALAKQAGMFKGKETVVDEKVSQELEKEMDEEIDKSIKAGVLPDPKKDKDLQKYNKKITKLWTKQKEKKQIKKSLKAPTTK